MTETSEKVRKWCEARGIEEPLPHEVEAIDHPTFKATGKRLLKADRLVEKDPDNYEECY